MPPPLCNKHKLKGKEMRKGTSVAMQIFGRMVAAPTGDISLPGGMCNLSTPGLSASSSPAGAMQSSCTSRIQACWWVVEL